MREPATVLELDLIGLRCPAPIVQLMRAARQLTPGDEIQATANDPAFEADVAAWCRQTGHELCELERRDGTLIARVSVKQKTLR